MSYIRNSYVCFSHNFATIELSRRTPTLGHRDRDQTKTSKGQNMSTQNHRRTRIAGAVALATMGTLVLASCSGSDEGSGSAGFSMTYATSNNLESPYEALANEYMETHDVDIELNPQPNDNYAQSLRTQLQGGNAADIIQTAPGSGQGQSLIELSDAGFLTKLGSGAEALVPEGSEDLFGADGVYGVPMDYTIVATAFNETAAAENDVTFPADTDELLATCADLGGAPVSAFALAGAAAPNTGMMALSISATQVYAEDPAWNQKRVDGEVTFAESEGWQATLELIVEMNEANCFQGGAAGAGFEAITNGLATKSSLTAFVPGGSVHEMMSGPAEGQELSIHPFPSAGEDDFILASSNYSLSLNASAGDAASEAAQDFLEWVASPEQSETFAEIAGVLPASGYADLDLSSTPYAPVADALQADRFVPLPNSQWVNQSVYDELGTGVQGLLTGQSTVDDVLTAMDQAWDN